MHLLINEQAVCERSYKNRKTAYLRLMDSNMVIAMLDLLLKGKAEDNVSTVQRSEAKENENGFLVLSCDTLQSDQWTCQLVFLIVQHWYNIC